MPFSKSIGGIVNLNESHRPVEIFVGTIRVGNLEPCQFFKKTLDTPFSQSRFGFDDNNYASGDASDGTCSDRHEKQTIILVYYNNI